MNILENCLSLIKCNGLFKVDDNVDLFSDREREKYWATRREYYKDVGKILNKMANQYISKCCDNWSIIIDCDHREPAFILKKAKYEVRYIYENESLRLCRIVSPAEGIGIKIEGEANALLRQVLEYQLNPKVFNESRDALYEIEKEK